MLKKLFIFVLVMLFAVTTYALGTETATTSERVLNDVWNDSQNSLQVGIVSADNLKTNIGTSIRIDRVSVDVVGTAQPLSADSIDIIEVTISREPTNLGDIYLLPFGSKGTIDAYILSKDSANSITIKTDNIKDISVDASQTLQRVRWVATLKDN